MLSQKFDISDKQKKLSKNLKLPRETAWNIKIDMCVGRTDGANSNMCVHKTDTLEPFYSAALNTLHVGNKDDSNVGMILKQRCSI